MTMQSKKQIQNQSQTGYMQSNEPQIAGEETGSWKMTKQFEKKQLKQIKNQSQSGRSMVEMLGVLAIIAILSIGGIIGFRLAMNYYQANQIAHEMNIMRTDAQIKIAQGTEKLTLGDPYDSGNIQFNDYGTDFGCIYMEDENAEPSPAFCTAANAYYIEMQNIPEGVCRPLANLIDNMDNEIAFYINEKSVDAADDEKGACSEGLNTLKVIFGADSDSEAIKCGGEGDPDCPENLPICFNHMCVQCKEDGDCPYNTDYCENNVCKTCTDNRVWGGQNKGCVECTTNGDCENPKPYCNPTSNRCEPCENDSQCDTMQKEYCKISTGECVVCEDGSEWDKETEECMSCSNRECADNSDCCKDYFCKKGYTEGRGATVQSNETGTCEPLGEVNHVQLNGTTFYGSDLALAWWDGCRWCEARSGQSGSQCDNNTYEPFTMVDVNDIDWQCELPDFKNGTRDQICCKGDGTIKHVSPNAEATCDTQNVSPVMKKLRAMYLGDENNTSDIYIWFKNYSREEGNNWRIMFANLKFGSISNNGYRYDNQYIDRFRTICK